MPDLSTIAGGPSTVASTPGSSTGISLTANASNHTKATTWTELISSTTYDANWVMVMLGGSGGSGSRWLVDIGTGASTSEQVLIPNLAFGTSSNTTTDTQACYLMPLRVARSTRISARCQSNVGSSTIVVGMHLIATPITAPPGLGRVEFIGNTAVTGGPTLSDPGGTAHTDGTWAELIASTAFPYKWMCLNLQNKGDVTYGAALTNLIDLAVGASSAEQQFISDILSFGETGIDSPVLQTMCFPVNLASGVRITARNRCSVTTAGDRVLDVAAWGVG